MERDKPDEVFYVITSIPKLAQGKQKITARFQSHPNAIAAGVFDVRIRKRE